MISASLDIKSSKILSKMGVSLACVTSMAPRTMCVILPLDSALVSKGLKELIVRPALMAFIGWMLLAVNLVVVK